MPRKRRQSRRGYLKKIGALGAILTGGAFLINQTGAFASVTSARVSKVSVAKEGNGLVGTTRRDSVKKNSRDPLVEFVNDHAEAVTITVSLDNCSDGTLYDPDGDSGCSVTYTLNSGNTEIFDLKASATGTISYSISISATDLQIESVGTVESEAGNNPGVVDVRSPSKDQDFEAYPKKDGFDIKAIDIRDNDGDDDLDHIEIEVTEKSSGGTTVLTDRIPESGSFQDNNNPGDGSRYAPGGQPDWEHYSGDEDYTFDVTTGTTYNLDFKAYDSDGNFATVSLDDDA